MPVPSSTFVGMESFTRSTMALKAVTLQVEDGGTWSCKEPILCSNCLGFSLTDISAEVLSPSDLELSESRLTQEKLINFTREGSLGKTISWGSP